MCHSEGTLQVREGLQLPDLRQSIIQLFFKHLTSPDEAIIATAQQGLAHVISNHKMPKGLLQLSLRPILVNLAYHNKLKLPLLKGLARLLQLLASWFNVTLGDQFCLQNLCSLLQRKWISILGNDACLLLWLVNCFDAGSQGYVRLLPFAVTHPWGYSSPHSLPPEVAPKGQLLTSLQCSSWLNSGRFKCACFHNHCS